MKKLLVILMALVLVVSFSSCGKEEVHDVDLNNDVTTVSDGSNEVIQVGDSVKLLNGMTVSDAVEKARSDYSEAESVKITQTVTITLNGEEFETVESVLIKDKEKLYSVSSFGGETPAGTTEMWYIDGVIYAKYGDMAYKFDVNTIKELIPDDLDLEELTGISPEEAFNCIPEFDLDKLADSSFTYDEDGYHAEVKINSESISDLISKSPVSDYITAEDIPEDMDMKMTFDVSGELDRIEERFSFVMNGQSAEAVVVTELEIVSEGDFPELPVGAENWTDFTELLPFLLGSGDFMPD